jgi:hypothetical protein
MKTNIANNPQHVLFVYTALFGTVYKLFITV